DQPPPRTGFGAWHLAYDEPVGPVRPLRDHGSHLRHREHASSVGTPRIIPLSNASTKRRSAHDPATPYGGELASPRRALLLDIATALSTGSSPRAHIKASAPTSVRRGCRPEAIAHEPPLFPLLVLSTFVLVPSPPLTA